MENQAGKDTKSPSQLIDERIEELGDWRGTRGAPSTSMREIKLMKKLLRD